MQEIKKYEIEKTKILFTIPVWLYVNPKIFLKAIASLKELIWRGNRIKIQTTVMFQW